MAQGGIFATDGTSSWGTWNRVFVKYCSSDFFSGDAPKSAETFDYAFRGSRIVSAVIKSLMDSGMGSGSELLFGGCSAGAIGAMNNIEAVHELVEPAGITMKVLLDAAALLNILPADWPWSSQLIPLQTLVQENTGFTQPVFPSYCSLHFPGAEWKCLIGQFRMPLITGVPMFLNMPQFDEFELMYDTDNYAPATPAQYSFVEQFQTGTLALIAALPATAGVFSPTCLVHRLSGQTTFSQLTVGGVSMDAALRAWYWEGTHTRIVSPCTGFDCTAQCGINLQTGLPCNTGAPGCGPIQLATDPGNGGGGGGGEDRAAVSFAVSGTDASIYLPPPSAAPSTVGTVSQTEPNLRAAQQQALCQSQVTQLLTAAAQQNASGQPQAYAQLTANAAAQQAKCNQQAASSDAGRRLLSAGAETPAQAAARDSETTRRLFAAAPACCFGAQA